LTLVESAFTGLTLPQKFNRFGWLAEHAGGWVSGFRAELVEGARGVYPEPDLRKILGAHRQTLDRIGDGPRFEGIRARLLGDAASLLFKNCFDQIPMSSRDGFVKALTVLERPWDATVPQLWVAAQRILNVARVLPLPPPGLTAKEVALYLRAIEHARAVVENLEHAPG
jgi:hypothetical protein